MTDITDDLLDASLDSWSGWRCSVSDAAAEEGRLRHRPRVLKALEGGLTNQNYLLEADKHLLVLRLNCVNEAWLGIDRYREREILEGLAGQTVAPELVYCQPERGILVTRYVRGRHWDREEVNDPVRWKRLLQTLERVHLYPGELPDFNYQAHIENYWRRLTRASLRDDRGSDLYRQAGEALEYLSAKNKGKSAVLCHHDPGPLNFIESDQGHMLLLDWEYSGVGWPIMDYAALLRQWQQSDELLQQSDQARYVPDELSAAHRVWDFIDHAWYRLREL